MNSERSVLREWLTLIASVIVAFAAVYLGVLALGWDLLGLGLLIENASSFARPLLYVVGICGIISLMMLFVELITEKRS